MPVTMPPPVYDAVVSFAFNVGVTAACGSLAGFIKRQDGAAPANSAALGVRQRRQIAGTGTAPGGGAYYYLIGAAP